MQGLFRDERSYWLTPPVVYINLTQLLKESKAGHLNQLGALAFVIEHPLTRKFLQQNIETESTNSFRGEFD